VRTHTLTLFFFMTKCKENFLCQTNDVKVTVPPLFARSRNGNGFHTKTEDFPRELRKQKEGFLVLNNSYSENICIGGEVVGEHSVLFDIF
jgi:hypothetical protein